MKNWVKVMAMMTVVVMLFVSCSSIPLADVANPSPYAMFVALDTPGKLTSPLYYVKGNTIKHIDDGLYGILLSQTDIVYMRQTAKMDNPELVYKNMESGRTVKLITPDQFGTIIGILASENREKIVLHIWPDGIATGNNLFVILSRDNILKDPTHINIHVINEGKLYSIIKWIAAIGDDGSIIYVGSNGAPDEALVYRSTSGEEKIIAKYKENSEFSDLITEGIHPPYEVAYIDSRARKAYILGKSGVWTYDISTGSLSLTFPLKEVDSQGLSVDIESGKLLVWGTKIGKSSVNIYDLGGKLLKTATGMYIYDPRIVNGNIYGIGMIKEKTIYSYTIGEVDFQGTATKPLKNRIFISQNDIKWWDITDRK